MPPQLALLAGLVLALVLLHREERTRPSVNAGSWLATIWLLIVGSRMLGQWLGILGLWSGGPETPEEGSSIDALFFLLLISAGIGVLARRSVRLSLIARQNVWLILFIGYGFLAVLWSDFPFIALKRWIKTLGHPVMVLLILTDPNPAEALRKVVKRFAYVHVPLSIVFIKYFPELGRGFDPWTGQAINNGINLNKNELGYVCMLLAIFFAWNLFSVRRLQSFVARSQEVVLSLGFLAMLAWLFYMADSATSVVCATIGTTMLVFLGFPQVKPARLGTYFVATVLAAIVLESTLGVYENTILLLNRNPTLTDRTVIWRDLLTVDINPVIGTGFESFWLGDRREAMWAKWWWKPNQAHNGYLETYINLGMVGVGLLVAVCISTFKKAQTALVTEPVLARFRLAVLFTVLAYNYTEAAFKGVHLVWTFFHIAALDYAARPRRIARKQPTRVLVKSQPHSGRAHRLAQQEHPRSTENAARRTSLDGV